MAPLYLALMDHYPNDTKVCITGQHRQMLDPVLSLFQIKPDYDLNIMRPGQDLADITCRTLKGLKTVFSDWRPDNVLVHGDTTTSVAAALAAFYERITVGHVEAGLRTYNLESPWPEEMNRQVTSRIAKWHFAPTTIARDNLLNEGVLQKNIFVTGNTVIDALKLMGKRLDSEPSLASEYIKKSGLTLKHEKMILVTGHRRENFGDGLRQICKALKKIAENYDVDVVYPVHLNPNVRGPVREFLDQVPNIHLIEPLDYGSFVTLMKLSTLILTDSGGIQEEAPALGKPVLVMRDTTERPEAITAGTAKLVGTDAESIYSSTMELLSDTEQYTQMISAKNPFGDGNASEKIIQVIKNAHGKNMESTN